MTGLNDIFMISSLLLIPYASNMLAAWEQQLGLVGPDNDDDDDRRVNVFALCVACDTGIYVFVCSRI